MKMFMIIAMLALMINPLTTSAAAQQDFANATAITLGTTISLKGTGAAVDGSTVKITSGGSYAISGTLTDGMIVVDTKEKVYIELNGVSITNSTGPALLITDAKRATLTLKAGTTSTLTDAKNSGEQDAVIFSNDTIEINGTGTLVVTGKNEEGISSDDDVIIEGGNIRISAADDGINAHDDITVNGGYVYVLANGDAIDSNGTINICGGTIILHGSNTGGDGGIDAKGTFTIKGGTVIATGNSFSTPSASSTQASIFLKTNQTLNEGTPFSINLGTKEVVTFAPVRKYKNVFYSSSGIIANAQYSIYLGGSVSGSSKDGLYQTGIFKAASGANPNSITAVVSPAGMGF